MSPTPRGSLLRAPIHRGGKMNWSTLGTTLSLTRKEFQKSSCKFNSQQRKPEGAWHCIGRQGPKEHPMCTYKISTQAPRWIRPRAPALTDAPNPWPHWRPSLTPSRLTGWCQWAPLTSTVWTVEPTIQFNSNQFNSTVWTVEPSIQFKSIQQFELLNLQFNSIQQFELLNLQFNSTVWTVEPSIQFNSNQQFELLNLQFKSIQQFELLNLQFKSIQFNSTVELLNFQLLPFYEATPRMPATMHRLRTHEMCTSCNEEKSMFQRRHSRYVRRHGTDFRNGLGI